MIFIIHRTELLAALKRASAAIVAGDLTYKSSVLVRTGDGLVTVGATDGILDVACQASASIRQIGSIVLPHRRLSSIVSELPPGMVEITIDNKFRASVKSLESKRKYTLTGLDPADFPGLLQDAGGTDLYSIQAKALQQCAGETAFAIDKGYIDGVLLSPIDREKFHLFALSSKASAIATGFFQSCLEASEPVVLPRILLEAAEALPPDESILITANEKKVTLRTPETTISCARLQQKFPPGMASILLDAMPKQKRFTVKSDAFIAAVKAVSVAADVVEGDTRFLQIDVRYQNGECLIHTRKSEKSFGEDDLVITEGAEGACVIHMDGALLSQALRAFSPVELDLYYDALNGYESLVLRNETLTVVCRPILVVEPKS